MRYDPTEFSSDEDYARSVVSANLEFGMPRQSYPNDSVGRLINQKHYEHERDMCNEFGWYGLTDADLRRKWNV